MQLGEISKAVALSLAVSAASGAVNVLVNANNQQKLLENNISATNKLADSLNDLKLQFASLNGTYVTRAELKEFLQDLRERNK